MRLNISDAAKRLELPELLELLELLHELVIRALNVVAVGARAVVGGDG